MLDNFHGFTVTFASAPHAMLNKLASQDRLQNTEIRTGHAGPDKLQGTEREVQL